MALTFYCASGSPYAWRVWLTLEHKGIPYELKMLSFDAGDLKGQELTALNPRQRVPVIVDEGFPLYESAAIVEYLEDKQLEPRLFSADVQQRALQRRMVREADQYFAAAMEHLADAVLFTPKQSWSDERIGAAYTEVRNELAAWERTIVGSYLAGELSAVDFTLYPCTALVQRIVRRKSDLMTADLAGPKVKAWMQRMEALPLVQKTRPPHWK